MANDRSTSNLFNPLVAWTDLGMRAAEMTIASSQNINEAFDRVTRAGAGAEPAEIAAVNSPWAGTSRAALPATVEQMAGLQRTWVDWITQGWVQWMSALGNLASMPAGIGLARTLGGQSNPLEAVRTSLRPAVWGEKPATERQVGSLTYPARRRAAHGTREMQHALAAGEAKPRRRATAKRKSARRTARK